MQRLVLASPRRRTGGISCTWRRSRATTGAASSGVWHAVQTGGRCSTTASGSPPECSVSPRWPSCPPRFLPLGVAQTLRLARQPIARRRLAAIVAVPVRVGQLRFQLLIARQQLLNLLTLLGVDGFQFGNAV